MSGDVTARKRKKKTNPPLIQEKNLDPKKNPPVGEEKKRRQIEITKTEVEVGKRKGPEGRGWAAKLCYASIILTLISSCMCGLYMVVYDDPDFSDLSSISLDFDDFQENLRKVDLSGLIPNPPNCLDLKAVQDFTSNQYASVKEFLSDQYADVSQFLRQQYIGASNNMDYFLEVTSEFIDGLAETAVQMFYVEDQSQTVQNPPVPAAYPPVPAQNPTVPTQNPPVPAQTPPVPAQNPPVPAQNTPLAPAQNPPVPAQNTPLAPAQPPTLTQTPPVEARTPVTPSATVSIGQAQVQTDPTQKPVENPQASVKNAQTPIVNPQATVENPPAPAENLVAPATIATEAEPSILGASVETAPSDVV